MLKQACEQLEIPMDVPYEDLSKADQQTVLYGSNGKTFHFHYQNDFGGVRDVDAVFEALSMLTAATTKRIVISPAM